MALHHPERVESQRVSRFVEADELGYGQFCKASSFVNCGYCFFISISRCYTFIVKGHLSFIKVLPFWQTKSLPLTTSITGRSIPSAFKYSCICWYSSGISSFFSVVICFLASGFLRNSFVVVSVIINHSFIYAISV